MQNKAIDPMILRRGALMTTSLVLSLAGFAACITVGEPERTPFSAGAVQKTHPASNEHSGEDDQENSPTVADYQSGATHAQAADWTRILKQKPQIRFQILHTGRVKVPRSGMLNLDHENLKGQAGDGEIFVDVYAYRICHTSRGCWLIDSGLDSSFRTGRGGNVSGLMAGDYIKGSEQSEGQDIRAQLDRLGDKPTPIQGVFFTHLHGDHTSGVPALPKDIRFIAGKDEAYINYYLLYYSDHLAGVQRLEEIDFTNAPVSSPLGRVVDLFGDGSFWAISTPGHSNGHVSYLLMTTDGPVLLTGDASHTRRGFEMGVEPGWTWNREKMRASLEQLIAFARKYPLVRVIFGHEL
ncbi:MAG: MBL fold metallo-hydrolase [bacterium]|nr:MBL fold metallo-hydrolase [bacterium]